MRKYQKAGRECKGGEGIGKYKLEGSGPCRLTEGHLTFTWESHWLVLSTGVEIVRIYFNMVIFFFEFRTVYRREGWNLRDQLKAGDLAGLISYGRSEYSK